MYPAVRSSVHSFLSLIPSARFLLSIVRCAKQQDIFHLLKWPHSWENRPAEFVHRQVKATNHSAAACGCRSHPEFEHVE